MAPRSGTTMMRIAVPLRSLAQRFAFVLLLASAVAIMLVGKADPLAFERARTEVTDFVTPLLDAVAQPVATGAKVIEEAEKLIALRAENAKLREENARLKQWQAAALNLQSENAQLRELLAYEPKDTVRYITARVVGDRGGAFLRSILINEGSFGGVEKGQAAITSDGLLGRVASVGENSSRVLLITDLNSRIPVMVQETRIRAVLAGDNSANPRLVFLSANAALQKGQRIVTSGHGDVFPPGLPVGIISEVGESGIRVRPFASEDRLRYIRLVDFGRDGILSLPAVSAAD